MNTTRVVVILTAIIAGVGAAHAGPFGAERLHPAQPLTDDVTLTPEALADVPAMEPFFAASGEPAEVQTRAWAFHGPEALHVVVECMEPKMDAIVAEIQPSEDEDAYVFSDDCVEVFVSATGSEDDYLHLAVNTIGARFDERVHDKSWSGDWTCEVTRADDRWWLRMAISYEALRSKPLADFIWWFNVSRQRQAGGETQLSSWSDAGRDFHDITHWGRLVFTDRYHRILADLVQRPWTERTEALAERAEIEQGLTRQLEQALAPLRDDLAPVRAAIEAEGPGELDELSSLLATGEAALERLDFIEEDLGAAIRRHEVAARMRRLADGRRVLAWPVRAITNRRIMPAPEPPERIERTIRMRACPGEFEPASFVVYPVGEEMTVLPVVSDLQGPGPGLRARQIDIHAIKRWYQAGEGGTRFPFKEEGVRALVPELLLHDDSLVRVDHEERHNYLKLRREDGDEYIWISFPRGEDAPWGPEGRANLTDEPVYDTDELQPVTIPPDTAKQFWVTVEVPEYLPAGTYRGEIELRAGEEIVDTLRLELEVLPFELEPNPLESSVYFHWGIDIIDEPGSLKYNQRSFSQYRAELNNLLDHAVDNPTFGVRPSSDEWAQALAVRNAVGMANDHLYYLIARASLPQDQIREIIQTARGFGFEDVYFYGQDEARGDELVAQREQWERVHEAGGKVFVAGQSHEALPLVGDLQDLLVNYGDPSAEAAAEWHERGHKIFCYANPQSGLEEPETYRRNFGLLLWDSDYDGGMTYIYYHGWNDFSGDRYRQHNFIYPTMDGCIDTIQWEGYREGIDDLRYLATLQAAIADARRAGGGRARLADRAQAFIDGMDVSGDLYELRDAMIEWTLRLRGER